LSTTDPCIAEATALLWVLEIARALRMDDIVIEGDAKICIEAFHNTATFTPWKIQSLISNAQTLSLNFSFVAICWVKREANMVAHSLAKVAAS
jgi:ribonuclease HI